MQSSEDRSDNTGAGTPGNQMATGLDAAASEPTPSAVGEPGISGEALDKSAAPAEPVKRKRRSRGSLSQEEILQASLWIIQEEGIEALSMRRIARKLGCSVASPYAHFKSQQAIINALIRSGENRLTQELKKAQASSTDVFEQLPAIAYTYWSFAQEHRELHKLMLNTGGGTTYSKVFKRLPTSYRVFMETIRNGIISGAIPYSREKYRAIARTMWAWMYGLLVLEMAGMLKVRPDDHPIEEGIAFFKIMLLKGDQSSFEKAKATIQKKLLSVLPSI